MVIEKLRPGGPKPSPELFELMADSVKDYAIFLLDSEGHVASWSKGAEAIKGYTQPEIIGKHFSVFYTPEDIERGWPATELRQAVETGRFEDEGWRIKKDGSRFWANVVITALKDEEGEILGYAKITRDLSDRKAADEKLRQSEERFRLLVEGVQDYAVYMLDPRGIVTSWNSGAAMISGYDADEVLGRHFSVFYAMEDVENGKPETELALARLHGRAEDEGYRVRKNGSRFWARVVVTPLYDSRGQLRGYAKVTQDLTQQKHAEALENVAKSINEFIAVLAHELRNPLAPIRSAVSILKRGEELSPQTGRVVEIIDRQSKQLMRIVDDILDVSRITRGTFSIIKQTTNVKDIITRSVEAAQPSIDQMGHTFIVDDVDPSLMIEGDEVRLTQALTNLLNNATRYTEPGGQIELRVNIEQNGELRELVISVHDNGRGIAPDLLGSIFGMFVQGEDKRSVSGTGLGVGLALARTIVERHQGHLEAASDGVGLGSKFTIRLPLARQIATIDEPESLPDDQPKLGILVADDNVDATVLLAEFFKKLGHDVFTAFNGEEAYHLFERHHPSLVLLDIGMPQMNGYELARQIRRHPFGKGTYLVAVTGWGKDEDRYKSKEAGIDLHLVKPVESSQLMYILAQPPLRKKSATAPQ